MGRVAAPFGLLGWIKVHPYTENIDGLCDYPSWWLGDARGWREYRVEDARAHGKGLVAKLEGCTDRDAALRLKGCSIAVPRALLPATKQEEYYWADLIGLRVVNTQQEMLGEVQEILETGANDVLRVVGERERLIPFIAQVILEVDLAAGVIRVEWGGDY